MLIRRVILVNPWFVKLSIFLLTLGLSSCGFQLNRNKVNLPGGAKNLHLTVVNQTYTSGLDLELQGELSRLLSAANVELVSAPRADLWMEVRLTRAGYRRLYLSLYNSQNYQFHFVDQVSLNLTDQRTHKLLFKAVSLTGIFNFETPATQLGTENLRYSRSKALKDVAKKIVARLGQNF